MKCGVCPTASLKGKTFHWSHSPLENKCLSSLLVFLGQKSYFVFTNRFSVKNLRCSVGLVNYNEEILVKAAVTISRWILAWEQQCWAKYDERRRLKKWPQSLLNQNRTKAGIWLVCLKFEFINHDSEGGKNYTVPIMMIMMMMVMIMVMMMTIIIIVRT